MRDFVSSDYSGLDFNETHYVSYDICIVIRYDTPKFGVSYRITMYVFGRFLYSYYSIYFWCTVQSNRNSVYLSILDVETVLVT